MKRVLAVCVLVVLAGAAAACGSDTPTNPAAPSAMPTPKPTPAAPPDAPPPYAAPDAPSPDAPPDAPSPYTAPTDAADGHGAARSGRARAN